MSKEAGPAARKFHAIGHSLALTGQVIGAAVGVVVGAAVAIGLAFTGVGAALCVACLLTGLGLGAALGKLIGSFFDGIKSGKIKEGAATIFYGREALNAARIKNEIECKDPMAALAQTDAGKLIAPGISVAVALGMGVHDGAFINEGTWGIFLEPEGFAASRLECQTSCGGKVAEGLDTIVLCGMRVYVVDPALITEDSAAMNWFLFTVDIVNTFLGIGALKTGGKIAAFVTQLGLKLTSQGLKAAGYPDAARYLDYADSGLSLVTGLKGGGVDIYKDVIPSIVNVGSNAKDQVTGTRVDPKTTQEMERYSRRMQRGTGRSWYETQYQLRPA